MSAAAEGEASPSRRAQRAAPAVLWHAQAAALLSHDGIVTAASRGLCGGGELAPKVQAIRVGPADDPQYYMGPVINERSRKTILDYIETGKQEGRILAGGAAAPPVPASPHGPRLRWCSG